jgi:hypothetical protein
MGRGSLVDDGLTMVGLHPNVQVGYPPQSLVSNSSSALMLPHAMLQGRLCGCGLRAACISECRRAWQRESAMLTCTRKLTPLLRILARTRLN